MTTAGNQFGDTTYTKVFVGGLAWETQKETMKKYFEKFGDILEAVVITDKSTGRSKGYGFVTFREPDAAMKACVDAAPVIDGRRANCNLASLGVQRSKPSTPKHGGGGGGGGGRNFKIMSSFQTGFQGAAFPSAATFPHYAIQQGFPSYNVYGYPPSYSSDYTYPTSYYSVYGGATGGGQYPLYGTATGLGGMMSGATAGFYPYLHQYGEGNGGAAAGGYSTSAGGHGGYGGLQFSHHHLFPYSAAAGAAINSSGTYPQHYGAPISLAPSPALQSGVTMALHASIPHR